MSYDPYPIKDSTFYNNGDKNIFKSSKNNCFPTQGYEPIIKPILENGNNIPLNEHCTLITGQLNKGPNEGTTVSPWNNMTKRKSLVKDY